ADGQPPAEGQPSTQERQPRREGRPPRRGQGRRGSRQGPPGPITEAPAAHAETTPDAAPPPPRPERKPRPPKPLPVLTKAKRDGKVYPTTLGKLGDFFKAREPPPEQTPPPA